jgi:hypothetical protein
MPFTSLDKLRRTISRHRKTGTTFLSFKRPMIDLCQTLPLNTVLEFGPGYSTEIILEYSSAKIISLETDQQWYQRYKDRFDPKRVKVIYLPELEALDITNQLGRDFSLVFIDGGDRLTELNLAFELTDEKGVVYLHDAHREEYEPGIRLYPYYYFPERHSCLLFKDLSTFRVTKASIPSDYSCHCQYCSTPERRAYFSKFVDL